MIRGELCGNAANWLNIYQLNRKLTIEQVAADIGRPVEAVRLALLAKNAPMEWRTAMSDRRARKSQRLKAMRQRWAVRQEKSEEVAK
jgi:hypothetical protein